MAKKMPVTWATFTVSALGLSGIPLFNGFISKWNLLVAAAQADTVMGYIGSVVLLNVAPGQTVFGNPAKPVESGF